MEVTQLPHLEQTAKIPVMTFRMVATSATTYATNIHLLTFSYTFKPLWTSLGKTLAAPVPLRFQTSIGLNQKLALRSEHVANLTPTLLLVLLVVLALLVVLVLVVLFPEQ